MSDQQRIKEARILINRAHVLLCRCEDSLVLRRAVDNIASAWWGLRPAVVEFTQPTKKEESK